MAVDLLSIQSFRVLSLALHAYTPILQTVHWILNEWNRHCESVR